MQKWRRVGGTGGGLPPVVTVIDWGGGGLALVPDFREIHVIRGDLKNPAEARGRPQAKHRAATRCCSPRPMPRRSRTQRKTERTFFSGRKRLAPMHNLFPSRQPGARTTCLRD